MRVSAAEKERSRERIIAEASRIFREQGIDGAGLAEIMAAAGMTHGGFYRHFSDKNGLVAAALESAFAGFAGRLEGGQEGAANFRADYLSATHVAHPGSGCPVAALGPDVARADEEVRAAFRAGVGRMVDALAGAETGAEARAAAFREFAAMVGAVVIARAAGGTLAEEVLAACRADGQAGEKSSVSGA